MSVPSISVGVFSSHHNFIKLGLTLLLFCSQRTVMYLLGGTHPFKNSCLVFLPHWGTGRLLSSRILGWPRARSNRVSECFSLQAIKHIYAYVHFAAKVHPVVCITISRVVSSLHNPRGFGCSTGVGGRWGEISGCKSLWYWSGGHTGVRTVLSYTGSGRQPLLEL